MIKNRLTIFLFQPCYFTNFFYKYRLRKKRKEIKHQENLSLNHSYCRKIESKNNKMIHGPNRK